MQGTAINTKSNFSANHLLLIVGVATVLASFTFMQQPQWLKQITEKKPAKVETQYYAYQAPPTAPAVLGASTNFDGPSVINEDGSISPAADIGSVLGVSTEDVQQNITNIAVRTMPTTIANVQQYFTYMSKEEADLDPVAFETALTSDNPAITNSQVQKFQTLVTNLQKITIPTDLVTLHRLRIIQYQAATKVLQNFSQLATNPDLVSQQLGTFLQAQEQLDQESTMLRQKYNL